MNAPTGERWVTSWSVFVRPAFVRRALVWSALVRLVFGRPAFLRQVRGTAAWPRPGEAARSAGQRGRDQGSVTAEIAVALPALVLVALAALWGVAIASAQLACADAARAGARAAARGESPAAVRVAVSRSAPEGARVSVRRDGELTQVMVRVTPWPAFAQGVSRLVIEERAVALTEPGVVP